MANRDDMDLMQYLDGELSPEEAAEVSAQLDASAGDRRKVDSIEQVGESMRTYLELAADDAEPRFETMWSSIERSIHANGASSATVEKVDRAGAIAATTSTAPGDTEGGIFAAIWRWFDGHRGYFATGAVTAGAVAALILVLRPPTERTVPGPERIVIRPAAPDTMPVQAPSPAVVEELNVSDGSGHILTIPGEDGEADTTVIWIEPNENTVEGPI